MTARLSHALVACAVAAVLHGGNPTEARAEIDWVTSTRAEDLQACLNRQMGGIVVGESRLNDGIMQERSAIDESFDRQQLTLAIGRCEQFIRCSATRGLSRAVAVRVEQGESHPAWSSNDRARLTDIIPQRIARQLREHPKAHAADDKVDATQLDTLEVVLEFGGTGWTHRELQDWVNTPRNLTVTLNLSSATEGAAIAPQRTTIKLPLLPRAHWGDTSTTKWLQRTFDAVDAGTRNLLDARGCSTEIIDVVRNRSGAVLLDISAVQGLRAGRAVLLVPHESTGNGSRWPLATVTEITDRVAALKIEGTAAEMCSRSECSAIAL